MNRVIAERIAARRKQLGKSQAQLAEDINITKQAVSNYEKGLRTPDFETLDNLAEALHTTLGYLIGADAADPAQQAREELAEDPDRKALLNLARYGSAQDVKQVAALIDALRATNPDFYDGDDPA